MIADDFVAEDLEVPEGTPIFPVERRSFTVGDEPGEFRQPYRRGDRYRRYRIDLR